MTKNLTVKLFWLYYKYTKFYYYIIIMWNKEIIAQGARQLETDAYWTKQNLYFTNGVLFSYWQHYPLLFKVTTKSGKVLTCCNYNGYSNTTARHINLASWHADVCVNVTTRSWKPTLEEVIEWIENRIQYLHKELNDCVRKVSKKKTRILEEIELQTKKLSLFV